jgi:hypothetical protein
MSISFSGVILSREDGEGPRDCIPEGAEEVVPLPGFNLGVLRSSPPAQDDTRSTAEIP